MTIMNFSPSKSTLWILSGILFLISASLSDDLIYMYATIGFAFITIGLSRKNKESLVEKDSEEGELLTDEEEKQVWEEFQGKVEEDEDGIS